MKDDALIVAGVALALLVAGWYVKRQAGAAVDTVTKVAQDAWDAAVATVEQTVPYVNPADQGNIVNRGVSAVGEAVTGQKGWNLGYQLFDWTH